MRKVICWTTQSRRIRDFAKLSAYKFTRNDDTDWGKAGNTDIRWPREESFLSLHECQYFLPDPSFDVVGEPPRQVMVPHALHGGLWISVAGD